MGSSSPAAAPQPLEIYPCAGFIFTSPLIRRACPLPSQPLSAVVLKRQETLTGESSGSRQPHIPDRLTHILAAASRLAPFQGNYMAAKFVGAGAATVGVAGSGAGMGLVSGSARIPSLKQQLCSAILGFALSEAMMLSCLMRWPFSCSSPCGRAVSTSQNSFSRILSAFYVPFSVPLQAAWGKRFAQGLTEGRQKILY